MAEQKTHESAISAMSSINLPLEVDTDGSGGESFVTHTSTRDDFVQENGRTYHKYKEGKYILPNDQDEQNRLDLQHNMMLILLEGRLHLAPIGLENQKVFDVGTGTGIWAIQFAERYSSCQVTGSDLSPIQPASIPTNCTFGIGDVEDDWKYKSHFTFIHMRGMMTCFSNPFSILQKVFTALTPGGYFELQDGIFPLQSHDLSLSGTALEKWSQACVEGSIKIGRPWTNTPKYRDWMIELGFEDVQEIVFEVPVNEWARGRREKELGVWLMADLLEGVGASVAILTRALGWEIGVAEELIELVRKDLRDTSIHAYFPIHVVYGRKPTE